MQRLFLVDRNQFEDKSYSDLLRDINNVDTLSVLQKSPNNLYENYLQLILSLIYDLPWKFTNPLAQLPSDLQHINFQNWNEVYDRVNNANYWRLILSTSGTTGVPKSVHHTFQSLTKSIKIGEHKITDVWGLSYNPQHMAGLQVFFQAFLNHNPLINLFGKTKEDIIALIAKYNISHISATPTFYKLLLPISEKLDSVNQVTFGGEKYNPMLEQQLRLSFPNANFTNVYASTEAGALFAAKGDVFQLNPSIGEKVKIKDGEIYIHHSILSQSDELTLTDGWYATGDMVEVVCENPLQFKIISRKNEMINVGGSKVNPNVVEDCILTMKGVKDVKVFGKANSLMGNILCADIVTTETLLDKDVKAYVKEHLSDYMVPRIIKFVSSIEMTDTGKKSRI